MRRFRSSVLVIMLAFTPVAAFAHDHDGDEWHEHRWHHHHYRHDGYYFAAAPRPIYYAPGYSGYYYPAPPPPPPVYYAPAPLFSFGVQLSH